MAKDTHYLFHNLNGGWDVKYGEGQRNSVHADTKSEAEKVERASGSGLKYLLI